MDERRTYPSGVPSWIDTEQPDLGAAQEFYGGLFGWRFVTVTPPEAPAQYVVAQLDGLDVAALAGTGGSDTPDTAQWNTYLAVDDADRIAEHITDAGGRVLAEPADVGEAGRLAICADPGGAVFRLWQARRRLGAQLVNVPNAWNFSDLHTDDDSAPSFYPKVFEWVVEDLGFARMLRRPGYGDHLAATIDPDIRERQRAAGVPPGFEDAIGWLGRAEQGMPAHWHVTFTVADRDESAETAVRLGGEVLATDETAWTRTALLRDPHGAMFTASQFSPPD